MMTVDLVRTPTLCLVFALIVAIPSEASRDRPSRLDVEPNAILRLDEPLTIEVAGVEEGQRVALEVFGDCLDQDVCPSLYSRQSAQADESGIVRDSLDHGDLVKDGAESLEGQRLWLRASFPGSSRYRQAMFGYVKDECSLFATLIDTFRLGKCKAGLTQVLRHHRQPSELADLSFEARVVAVDDPTAEAVSVVGTTGATGVAWLDHQTLLVTFAGEPGGSTPAAGVYEVSLDAKRPGAPFWSPEEGEDPPTAPMTLPGERVALAIQAPGVQSQGEETPSHLVVLDGQASELLRIPLPYKVHQLLARDPAGRKILALSLGVGDNRPVLLMVDLESQGVAVEGFSEAVYEALMRNPRGEQSVIAFENTYPGHGWEIVLTQDGKLLRPLVKRFGSNDLAPTWDLKGQRIAYLAQVGHPE